MRTDAVLKGLFFTAMLGFVLMLIAAFFGNVPYTIVGATFLLVATIEVK